MRVMVLGATGNLGSAVVERLAGEDTVTEVVGVARRTPHPDAFPHLTGRVTWRSADIRRTDWRTLLAETDVLVHLAWMMQPMRHPDVTWSTNARALDHLLEALPHTPVTQLVVASSIAAYSPRPVPEPVDESWPTHGTSPAVYCREKAYVERLLDRAEAGTPVITRLRPAFVFQRRAASEQKRIFVGRVLPRQLLRPGLLPLLPVPRGLRLQSVHAEDVADAVARAVRTRAAGPFNLCAPDVLWPEQLGRIVGARPVPVPAGLARGALAAAWTARLVPVEPPMLDALLNVPVMSAARAAHELGWTPRHSAESALRELVSGVAPGAGAETAPLAPG